MKNSYTYPTWFISITGLMLLVSTVIAPSSNALSNASKAPKASLVNLNAKSVVILDKKTKPIIPTASLKSKSVNALTKEISLKVKVKETNLTQVSLLKLAKQKTPLTGVQLVFLLESVGFSGKALKTAWAVVKKESNGRPMAFNGNKGTGDSSYGIFQINMMGGLGDARRDKYNLDSNNELFSPKVNAEIAFHMSNQGNDWSSWKVGKGYKGNDQKKFLKWYKKFPERDKI